MSETPENKSELDEYGVWIKSPAPVEKTDETQTQEPVELPDDFSLENIEIPEIPLEQSIGEDLEKSVDIEQEEIPAVEDIELPNNEEAAIADEISEKVIDYGVCVVPKPVNKALFFQSMKILTAVRSRVMGYQKENAKLQVKIDEIKLINRAKCVLMQYLKLTEPQAHRYIEKQAMDTRKTRKEVAQSILLRYEQ